MSAPRTVHNLPRARRYRKRTETGLPIPYTQQVILNLQNPEDSRLKNHNTYPGGAAGLRQAIQRRNIWLPSPGGTSRSIWIDGELGDAKGQDTIKDQILLDLPRNASSVRFPGKIQGHCRLYIIGHGLPGCDELQGTDGKWHYNDFAELITQNIAPGTTLRVSLIACYGGSDSGARECFAKKLFDSIQSKLRSKGIILYDLEVVGRTGGVARRTATVDHHTIDGRVHAEGDMILVANDGVFPVTYKDQTDLDGVFKIYDAENNLKDKAERKSDGPFSSEPSPASRVTISTDRPSASINTSDCEKRETEDISDATEGDLDLAIALLLSSYTGRAKVAVEKAAANFREGCKGLIREMRLNGSSSTNQLNALAKKFKSEMAPYINNSCRNWLVTAVIVAAFTLVGAAVGSFFTPAGSSAGATYGYMAGSAVAGCVVGFFADHLRTRSNPKNATELVGEVIGQGRSFTTASR